MKLVSMQPYFFPYLGYFDLANMADIWIVYDTPQHIPQGWVHRNRILHPQEGWQYIVAPLKKHPHNTPIHQLEIAANIDWKSKIFGQLTHYKKNAPFYAQTVDFLMESLNTPDLSLAQINTRIFRLICKRLGIETSIRVFSKMQLPSESGKTPEETAISKCLLFGADEYINPPGGAALYHAEKFAERGIKLTIQSFANMKYECGRYQYEPALSIIDVMMWNAPEKIRQYLNTFRNVNEKVQGEHNGLCIQT